MEHCEYSIRFSVLLSVYIKENALYLKQSLDSIFNQTLLPNEIVLVKDGPLTKELDGVIEDCCKNNFVPIRVVALKKNGGLGNALKEGLSHCSYELVARMDTDDIAKPSRFERQIKVLCENPDIDVVGTWIDEFLDDTSNVLSVRKLPENNDRICKFAKKRNPINHPTVMFRKSAVIASGGYKHFPLFEDYYLWVRMLLNGKCFYNIQESLLYFRISPDVYKRRGGWKYAIDEYRLRKMMYNSHFISFIEFISEVPFRFLIRILPSWIRKFFYLIVIR